MRLTYCTVQDVNIRATDEKQKAWTGLTDDEKTEIIFRATDDIKAAHQKPDSGGLPWGYTYLRECAESRCLYLARVKSLRDVRERSEYLGADSIDDGILSLSSFSKVGLDPISAGLLSSVMKAYGSIEEFCRG